MARLIASLAVLTLVAAGCTGSPGQEAKAGAPLTLSPDGFGTTRMGATFEPVMEALRARWGPPDRTQDLGCDSLAQSKIVNWDGVQLVFGNRGLVGYRFGPAPEDPITPVGTDVRAAVTAEGLHLGDTVARARELYGDRFDLEETSLGPEWFLDPGAGDGPTLAGFAGGLDDTDTVTQIYAGDICAVR